MFDRLQICLQHYLPKQLLTRLAGRVANCQLPWLSQTLIKLFIRYYQVDMQESAVECKDFRHFNDFFTRPLKADARIIDAQADSIVCPADGLISQCGAIEADQLLQAKGQHYSSLALLAGDYQLAEQFSQGQFVTTYLSPRDYHRVHMPCQGTLREMIYVPGDLFSVNLLTAQHVENLFARNERVICLFDTALGPMAQILVGATIVGSIETVWAGCITPPRPGIIQRYRYPASGEQAIVLAKGQEMGRFKLGSTVINLFAANTITLQLAASQRVNYGQMLAMINH